jgi:hypothetical protein
VTRGQKFAQTIRADYNLTPDLLLVLDELAGVIDEIDALPKDAIVERRQQRALASRLVYQLGIDDYPDEGKATQRRDVTSLKARRAARARWGDA